jgi:hypothetical protein
MLRPLIFLCCASLAGCAPGNDFPSLAPRPIEKADSAGTAAPPAAGADAALAGRLATIVEAGEAGHRAFIEEAGAARSAISAGGATGSESWVSAQAAYSRVDSAHSALLSALADLDALRREQAESPNPAHYEAANAAAARLEALSREEDATLAELAAKLG